ncbi:MAG: glycosyltransferase [Bacteroidia bacterium]|nr:glycosyltransferase [Bacteroidia bacterium]MBT8276134.1 glycosyltransferase [Bacteroidia bacterium]NNF32456.1 glycosyltransferase [Flavobacteriaceae bacterium]NNJ82850.1 glycosyltransferase [Flavobacteriaceae bacterium]NNM08427.1 glycosyltransferase [Flavobacteriaceae bacterium]
MKVLQLIDSLHPGGAERIAISLANGLAETKSVSHLCITREEGLLKETISPKVSYFFLEKKRTLDLPAFNRLRNYIKKHEIEILHAHSSSFFLATWIKLRIPGLKLIWHDHYGQSESMDQRSTKILKLCSRKFHAIISVNRILQQWAKSNLHCANVVYLKNFIDAHVPVIPSTGLKGKKGHRLVCLANFRPQKDHITLLDAFRKLVVKYPDWSLHLIGKKVNQSYTEQIEKKIEIDNIPEVYIYGEQLAVLELLSQADIGVLSSRSEGLPVALLEYGLAGLPVVTTKVGQCEEVVGEYGITVPPASPGELSKALAILIKDSNLRKSKADAYSAYIKNEYTFESIKNDLLKIYRSNA